MNIDFLNHQFFEKFDKDNLNEKILCEIFISYLKKIIQILYCIETYLKL